MFRVSKRSSSHRCRALYRVPLLALSWAFALGGCTREHYREDADEDVYSIVSGETRGTPWQVPAEFSVEPAPESRLHDPSDPDFPVLPDPTPSLYSYEITPPRLAPRDARAGAPDARESVRERSSAGGGLPIQPIPADYWDSIPRPCLARMVEFETVRDEYEMQYGEPPSESLRDPSPRLTLEDIFELALLNSREYQTQKETLYRAALTLTLERFAYLPKFLASGNGFDLDWTEDRNGGTTTSESTGISGLALDALLITGGRLLARLTNNVVLAFDGVEGFSRQVSSEVLVSLSQSILQRDIRLNPLIQAERDLVYAARSFIRFRKVFFVDIASRYYSLLQNYRSIEIEAQNYFSLVRTFEQARAELRAGVRNAPNPVAVDQFEQGMLSGRSSLISTCNRLEQSLDSLKLALGIPTETPMHIDLSELDELTVRDQLEVNAERVRRWLARVRDELAKASPERAEILNADIFLLERLLELLSILRVISAAPPDPSEIEALLRRLRVEEARLEAERSREELERTSAGERAPAILVYERTDALIEVLIELLEAQVALGEESDPDGAWVAESREAAPRFRERLEAIRRRIVEILQDLELAGLESALEDAARLREEVEAAVARNDRALGQPDETPGEEEELAQTLEWTDRVIQLTTSFLESIDLGLPEVAIAVDDAMRTALAQRFDLMNERGRLADRRRNIKLSADDLRSVIDLDASYAIRTEDDKPIDFTLEESRTQVALTVDLPLNRRAQRNDYRRALLEYHAARRRLMELEDTIKLDVRDGLRRLEETRLQYPISVTQAALAAEQVISVRLQLALGVEGVRGTDLLDALQSSREALIAVANRRIGYIIDRALFILDLEVIELDETGFWREIDDSEYQPRPDVLPPENGGPAYGRIPWYLLVSPEIRALGEDPPREADPEEPQPAGP